MEKLLSNVQYCFKFVKIVYHTANICLSQFFTMKIIFLKYIWWDDINDLVSVGPIPVSVWLEIFIIKLCSLMKMDNISLINAKNIFFILHYNSLFKFQILLHNSEVLNTRARCSSVVRAFARGAMGRRIHPSLSYFLFQPVLHGWFNKACGVCYPVCGMMHIKEPLLLIRKSSPCGCSGVPLAVWLVLYHMSDAI